jgi:hypothetical protein
VTSPTHRTARPAMWADKPMPDGERQLLTALSAGVWLIALAMNVSHVYDHLGQEHIGIDDTRRAVLCLAPDVLLLIGVWKLRYRARSSVAWAMVATGLGWLAWSALSTAEGSPSAWVLAVAPIGVAVLTTLALEFKHADAPAVTADTQPVRNAVDAPPSPIQPTAPDVADVQPGPKPAKRTEPAKGAPSREEARAILMGLEDFEAVSNGHLSREHGCSDVWWGRQKKALRAELAELTTEANAL